MATTTAPPEVEQEKTLVTWVAKSRPFKKDTDQSRQVLVVLGVLIGMVLVFAGEWMLLAVIAAGAFYYYASNTVSPEDMEYNLTNIGIKAYGRTFGWWEFRRWWWAEKWNTKMIGLDLQTGVMGRLFLPIDKEKEADIEKVMKKYLFYEKPNDTPGEKAMKWVGEKFPLENKI